MLDAIRSFAFYAVVIGCLATSFGTRSAAQSLAVMSPQLRDFLPTPVAAAYHPRTRSVLLGLGTEVKKMEQGTTGRLVDSGQIRIGAGDSILRLRVDARRDRLWVLDIGSVRVFDLVKNQVIRTVPLPNWMFAPSDNCLPDLQLDEQGAAFISDSIQPKLWRVDPDDFSVQEHTIARASHLTLDVGFSALAITGQGVMFAAMAAPGLLWRIDTARFRAENITLSSPVYGACALESQRAAGSRDLMLFVLTTSRSRFDVQRVVVAAGKSVARVDLLTAGPATLHAALLSPNSTLSLVAEASAAAVSKGRQSPMSDWVLRPIATDARR